MCLMFVGRKPLSFASTDSYAVNITSDVCPFMNSKNKPPEPLGFVQSKENFTDQGPL